MKILFLILFINQTIKCKQIEIQKKIIVVRDDISDYYEDYKADVEEFANFLVQNFPRGEIIFTFFESFEILVPILEELHQMRLKNQMGYKNMMITRDEEMDDLEFNKMIDEHFLIYENEKNFFINNVKENFKNLHKHINTDYLLLSQNFFQNDQKFIVMDISMSQGDVHKLGGGVSIIVLSQDDQEAKTKEKLVKIVYKPSSLEMDYLITGNSSKLKEHPLNENRSFFEIINSSFLNSKNSQLETYLIIPMPIDKSIESPSYGYLEFIKSDSTPIESLKKKIPEIISEEVPIWLKNKETEYFEIDSKWKEIEPNETNIFTESENSDFSFQNGIILAVIKMLNSNDLHHENVLVRNKKIILIDLENSLSYKDKAFETALNLNHGGIIYNLQFCLTGDFYFNYKNDKNEIVTDALMTIGGFCKRFFNENRKSDSDDFQLIYEQVENGYQSFFDYFIENPGVFDEILPSLENVFIRDVALKTQDFLELKNGKSLEKIKEILKMRLKNDNYLSNFVNEISEDLFNGFVPSFYFNTSEKFIYDSNNQKYLINKQNIENEINFYIEKTPLEFFKERLQVMNKKEYKTEVQNSIEEIKKVLKVNDELILL